MRKELATAARFGDEPEVRRLLVDATDNQKRNALAISVMEGKARIVVVLLRDGVRPQSGLLNQAVRRNYLDIVSALLSYGSPISPHDRDWFMWYAGRKGVPELATAAIAAGGNLNAREKSDKTALIHATCSDSFDVVRILLDAGASVNELSSAGMSALMYAAQHDREEILDLLLSYGAHTELRCKNDKSAYDHGSKNQAIVDMLNKAHDEDMFYTVDLTYFLIATRFGFNQDEWTSLDDKLFQVTITMADGFNILITRNGLDMVTVDVYGRSLLMFAAYAGYGGIVAMLLFNGAKVTEKDKEGMTALIWAVYGRHKGIAELLLRYRTPLNISDRLKRTALHHALRHRDYQMAYTLVVAGEYIYTPVQLEDVLVWASTHGYNFIINSVLVVSKNANDWDRNGVTALMYTAVHGHLETVKLLLEYPADVDVEVNSMDKMGRTALWYAIINGHLDIQKLLREKNATLRTAGIELTGLRLAVVYKRVAEVQDILKKVKNKTAGWEEVQGFKSLVHAMKIRAWEIANLLVAAAIGDLQKNRSTRRKKPVGRSHRRRMYPGICPESDQERSG